MNTADEYISRAKTIARVKAYLKREECDCEFTGAIFEALDIEPAADVTPVRHGHWYLHDGGNAAECSLCSHLERARGRRLTKDEWRKYSPFCRLCGAKMDGGD